MSIEAVWVIRLLRMILILAMFIRDLSPLSKNLAAIKLKMLYAPELYLNFPARIINHVH